MNVPPRLERIIRAARLFVDVEHLWSMARWPLLVLCIFLILALFGLLPRLPAALHVTVLIGFAGALAFAFYQSFRGFRPASRTQALDRLETDSGFSHAPLQALDDRLAGGEDDPFTQALWTRHKARLSDLAANTRLRPPRSSLPRLDPWAIRAGVVLVLAVALVDSEGRMLQRLREAVIPGIAARTAAEPVTVTLWVEPPAYTRLPPRMIAAGGTRTIVPAGSQALVQVHHLPDDTQPPAIVYEEIRMTATRLGEASAEARLQVDHDGDLVVADEGQQEISRFLLAAQPDRIPTVQVEGEPSTTLRGALEVGWSGADDYGLVSVALEVVPVDGSRPVERIALKSLPEQPRQAKGRGYLDTTPHPLAGADVSMVLVAVDALGQEGRSQPITMKLPERTFEHPVAKAIIDQRKDLTASPEDRADVAEILDQLAGSKMMEELPSSVPLSLSSAAERLRRNELPEQEMASVLEQLWDTALFVEEGRMASAERDMRRIQEELERALAENQDDAQIDKLMDELQEAMDRYLDELSRQAMAEAMRNPEAMERAMRQPQRPGEQDNTVERQDLQRMLDKAREMMKSGSREAAEEMLAQLREMMENLQAQLPGEMAEPSAGEQALSDLQEAIRRQQMLQDEAFKMDRQMNGAQQQQPGDPQEGQQGQQGQAGQEQMTPEQLAQLQEMLRRQLGQIMEGLAEDGMKIPGQLGDAELQMRGAEGKLQQGSPGAATDPQGQAMALMQEAGRGIMDQMRQQMGEGEGQGPGRPGGTRPGQQPGQTQTGWQRDPLGRAPEGMGGPDSDSTSVPDEAALGRARAVLEELYRRSGDPSRPRMELDYYDRLLKRF